jgi:hypothetical protein
MGTRLAHSPPAASANATKIVTGTATEKPSYKNAGVQVLGSRAKSLAPSNEVSEVSKARCTDDFNYEKRRLRFETWLMQVLASRVEGLLG